MTAEVVGIRGDPVVAAAERRQQVIDQLEELLERAKSGDIQGVQIVTLHSDGTVGYWPGGLIQYNLIGRMFAAAADMAREHESK